MCSAALLTMCGSERRELVKRTTGKTERKRNVKREVCLQPLRVRVKLAIKSVKWTGGVQDKIVEGSKGKRRHTVRRNCGKDYAPVKNLLLLAKPKQGH